MSKHMAAVAALLLGVAPAFAAQEHLDIISQQCGIQIGQTPAVCGCMAQSAGAQLSENQQAFMAAQVTANGPEIARTQGLLSPDEAVSVMQFMTTIVQACGG